MERTSEEKPIIRGIDNRLLRRQMNGSEDPACLVLQTRDIEVEMRELVEQHRPLRLREHDARAVAAAGEVADAVRGGGFEAGGKDVFGAEEDGVGLLDPEGH